jgi:hypothetical protein
MKRHIIEHDILGIGELSLTELYCVTRASNNSLVNISPEIHWQYSYVAGDKTYCVYLAESEDEIRKHSERAASPMPKSLRYHRSSIH